MFLSFGYWDVRVILVSIRFFFFSIWDIEVWVGSKVGIYIVNVGGLR